MQQIRDFVDDNTEVVPDGIIWTPDPYSEFSLSSAHEAMRYKAASCLSSKCIWGGGIPSKVSLFMWRLLRAFLPFPDVIKRFNVCLPSVCALCHQASAELEHCLYQCNFSKHVWRHFQGIFGATIGASSLRTECHAWWLLAPPGSVVDWYAKLVSCLILWHLWCSYNQGVYGDGSHSVSQTLSRIKQDLFLVASTRTIRRLGPGNDFLLTAGFLRRFHTPPIMVTIWVKWMTPPSGRLKLNTDATYGAAGVAGGACLRDSRG
ncbi:PREDICTED: uncharacterized protein LOC109181312 [Ipomoea nil]|uniref:uncharacterized protein LOC109181312 n=1 Tax=Ipomoea nil TaxID=35883 RepID=UPI000901D55E|nr:PREDICTED: uncharacterized protein LOC109181312 [Ipomoea nil]